MKTCSTIWHDRFFTSVFPAQSRCDKLHISNTLPSFAHLTIFFINMLVAYIKFRCSYFIRSSKYHIRWCRLHRIFICSNEALMAERKSRDCGRQNNNHSHTSLTHLPKGLCSANIYHQLDCILSFCHWSPLLRHEGTKTVVLELSAQAIRYLHCRHFSASTFNGRLSLSLQTFNRRQHFDEVKAPSSRYVFRDVVLISVHPPKSRALYAPHTHTSFSSVQSILNHNWV